VEVRHINRSSSATRHPKVDTSTICCVYAPVRSHILWLAVLTSLAIAVIDTLNDTLTVQNGPGITDAWEQFELGYPSLEP
jgi:hypothetical protein